MNNINFEFFSPVIDMVRTRDETGEPGPSSNQNVRILNAFSTLSFQAPPQKSNREMILDMQEASFGDEFMSDCEVHVGDKIFKISKYFLCLHSEVFSAYLNSDSIENTTKTIKITDLDPVFVEAMLKFMYSGKVDNLKDIAHDLYVVADRYNVKLLQVI